MGSSVSSQRVLLYYEWQNRKVTNIDRDNQNPDLGTKLPVFRLREIPNWRLSALQWLLRIPSFLSLLLIHQSSYTLDILPYYDSVPLEESGCFINFTFSEDTYNQPSLASPRPDARTRLPTIFLSLQFSEA